MKLSELVKIKKSLDELVPSEYETSLNQSISGLKGKIENTEPSSHDLLETIASSQKAINLEFANIRQSIQDYKKYIESCISSAEEEYYSISNQIYQGSKSDDSTYILNRRKESLTFADKENFDLFISRLGMYNSWKYPAIELRPAFGEITEFVKGCDPLYLIDANEDLFVEARKKWNLAYQRRLRYYTINENNEEILKELPNNQFGLIVSADYFNFRPLNILENFLKEFYIKLKPGGVVMFTYNNCDLPYAVRNVENRFCCYTPGHTVIKIAENIGFEIIKNVNRLENISWLEIRKPGEITTIRGGQTLAEIKSFSVEPKKSEEEKIPEVSTKKSVVGPPKPKRGVVIRPRSKE